MRFLVYALFSLTITVGHYSRSMNCDLPHNQGFFKPNSDSELEEQLLWDIQSINMLENPYHYIDRQKLSKTVQQIFKRRVSEDMLLNEQLPLYLQYFPLETVLSSVETGVTPEGGAACNLDDISLHDIYESEQERTAIEPGSTLYLGRNQSPAYNTFSYRLNRNLAWIRQRYNMLALAFDHVKKDPEKFNKDERSVLTYAESQSGNIVDQCLLHPKATRALFHLIRQEVTYLKQQRHIRERPIYPHKLSQAELERYIKRIRECPEDTSVNLSDQAVDQAVDALYFSSNFMILDPYSYEDLFKDIENGLICNTMAFTQEIKKLASQTK